MTTATIGIVLLEIVILISRRSEGLVSIYALLDSAPEASLVTESCTAAHIRKQRAHVIVCSQQGIKIEKPMQIISMRVGSEYSLHSVSLTSVNPIIYFAELDRI